MIYDDNHLFVALPKHASSFVEKFLLARGWNRTDPRPLRTWVHAPYCAAPEYIRAGREPFAVMRDPWSFYRSIHRYPHRWRDTTWTGFQEWLSILLDGKPHLHYPSWQKLEMDIFYLMAKWDIGLQTIHYIVQCAEDCGPFIAGEQAPEDAPMAVHTHLSTENLRADLGSYLNLSMEHLEALQSAPRENVSVEAVENYTPELIQLVAHRERLILERFGYEVPKCLS